MDVHEVLVEARNRIARNGWWRESDDMSSPGTECAYLALDSAASGGPVKHVAAKWLAEAAGITLQKPEDIYRWNDSRESVEEVLAAFARAISLTAPEPYDVLAGKVELVEEPTCVA